MRTWRTLALSTLLVLALTACRQADGQMPTPVGDRQNEIHDIARDMLNVMNSDPDGSGDLSSDISKYGQDEEAVEASRELARRLAEVLPSARLDEQSAQRLAHTVWVGVTATELSERQIEAVKNDVREILRGAGVEEPGAEAVAEQLGAVQQEITHNPRRWYQVF